MKAGRLGMLVDGFHLRESSTRHGPWSIAYAGGGVWQHAVEAVRSYLADENRADRLHVMAEEFGIGVSREIGTLTEAMHVAWERVPMEWART